MSNTPHSSPLALLLQLEQRARQSAATAELWFVIVNETHQLFPYQQAVLWNGEGKVLALSGVAMPDANAPFVLWLQELYRHFSLSPAEELLYPFLQREHLPEQLQQDWREWLPPQALLLPLQHADKKVAWLLLTREEPFSREESALLTVLAESYAFALHYHTRRQSCWHFSWLSRYKFAFLLLLAALLAWPVSLSVLGPAELVPIHPEVIRAPMDGVIARFHVSPNDTIQPGQALLDLDDTIVRGRLDMAEKSYAIAESEYQLTAQIALQDPRSKAQLTILAGRAEEKKIEVEALREQLQRTKVQAKQAGLALFSDPLRWIGKPVVTGERILVVAEEYKTEVEIWLAVGDLIPIAPGAPVTLFLNIDPLHPMTATVRLLAYEAELRPDHSMAHLVRATLQQQSGKAQVGWKGTARIDGEQVSVLWWMLRRPIAMVRQWLGI
ncbi:HlyD family efflux transporter periplasmic adaptor subunit [Candidatus Magnetaquicoccus inordinatus]|uniref:HlyD family efflux transporter periplasmic adaptor subunit n=1 Tax=Candidatus Magnetaquicoccus inordinatus TaxID=2496818 RepID=UPI00102CAF49|nr:HlyD family efflux transporter periplasmic adaptor subunit [Candidatus Magnetaquicoccus inordinatus]